MEDGINWNESKMVLLNNDVDIFRRGNIFHGYFPSQITRFDATGNKEKLQRIEWIGMVYI